MTDFENNAQALATADAIVEESAATWGFVQETIQNDNPILVKCFYIHSEGRRRSAASSEVKKIEGLTELKNNPRCLADAAEVTGGTSIFDKVSPEDVKLEFPQFAAAKVECEKNKSIKCKIMGLKFLLMLMLLARSVRLEACSLVHAQVLR